MNAKMLKAAVAGAAAVAVLAGGSTYAGWFDEVTFGDNTVGAGTLTLGVADPRISRVFDNVRLAPGQGKDEWTKLLSNDGDSVPNGELKVKVTDLQVVAGSTSGAKGTGKFAEQADFKLVAYRLPSVSQTGQRPDCGTNITGGGEFRGTGNENYNRYFPDQNVTAPRFGAVRDSKLAQASEEYVTFVNDAGQPLVLAPGQVVCVGSSVTLPSSATNDVQGDVVTFDLDFRLDQTSGNPDFRFPNER